MFESRNTQWAMFSEGYCCWSYEYPDFLNSDGDFVEFDACFEDEDARINPLAVPYSEDEPSDTGNEDPSEAPLRVAQKRS